jgi:molecular chaperone IbpA
MRISFGPLTQTTLGFDKLFDEIERTLSMTPTKKTVNNYPPHNIIKTDDNKYVVELAIAGFMKDEITVEVKENTLTISGSKSDQEELNYIYRGIGTRAFTKTITISDTMLVHGAEFKNGILRIGIENVIPEERKPRKIEIGNELNFFKPTLLQEEKLVA